MASLPQSLFAQTTVSEAEDYVYDPVGRRDPFRPWRPFSIRKAVAPTDPNKEEKVIEITDPLLKHEVERYNVLGIMWDVARPRALLKDPEGKTHMVFIGTRLGRNGGVIQTMREGEVVVAEKVDVNGEMKLTTKLLEVKAKSLSGGVLTSSKPLEVPPGGVPPIPANSLPKKMTVPQ